MTSYFEYLRKFLTAFFQHLGTFLFKAFISPWGDVGSNFNEYNSLLGQHSPEFGFFGWFFWVLFLILGIGLVGGLLFLLFILLRKYIRFVKKEYDKEEQQREIEQLHYELYQAVQEKDKILNLKTP